MRYRTFPKELCILQTDRLIFASLLRCVLSFKYTVSCSTYSLNDVIESVFEATNQSIRVAVIDPRPIWSFNIVS